MAEEYIKKKEAINAIATRVALEESADRSLDLTKDFFLDYAEDVLEDCKSTDVVEVVRCKDCKWFGKIGCSIEVVDETDMPKENDFCSFGERKTDE